MFRLRFVALLALLPTEAGWIVARFSGTSFVGPVAGPAQIVDAARSLLTAAIVFAAALLLVVSPRLTVLGRSLQAHGHSLAARWVLPQATAFAGFAYWTSQVFGVSQDPASVSWAWLAGWMALGSATLITWLLALAPTVFWVHLVRQEWEALLIGAIAGMSTWLGPWLAEQLWRPLAAMTLTSTQQLLTWIYPEVVSDSARRLVGTPSFTVEIAAACSGYEGMGLVVVFVALYLGLFRRQLSFPRALLLLPIGIVTIWLTNILRITALIAVGTSVSPAIALGGFHSEAGWIAFTLVALGLIRLSHGALLLPASGMHPLAHLGRVPIEATALLVPLMVLSGTTMVSAALSSDWNSLYPLGVVAAAAALWHYRAAYRSIHRTCSPEAIGIGVVVFAIWLALEPSTSESGQTLATRLAELPAWLAGLWIGLRVLGSVLVVPIVEELAFRGYLLRKLVARDFETVLPGHFTWLSFVGSSLLFGLLHGRWLAGTLAGACFAVALYRRGRLSDAVVAHITANALIAACVVLQGHWGLWS